MTRHRVATLFIWAVACVGFALLLGATALQAPHDLAAKDAGDQLQNILILLVLTFLSSISPVQTKLGAIVTVGLAPLFGAYLLLHPWAVMWVAALGTIDERIPGRKIPWDRFLFNRGMYVMEFGIPSLLLHGLGVTPGDVTWFLLMPIGLLLMVVINVGALSIAFSLLQGTGVVTAGRRMLSGRAATYIALPLVGYLIYALLLTNSSVQKLLVFLLYGPLLVYRASLQKQNRLDRWLRDSFIMQSRIVDKRDGQTFGHSQRVGELCEAVARRLHLSDGACNTIRVAGILHDLGKIAIPDSILLKPAKLTPEEYEIIKTHPVEGANILAEHPEQQGVAEIVRHHHEKWDGTGYPDALRGDAIPIGARIVDACDAFDTITQARVFRPTVKTPTEAIRELRGLAGKWYDPEVIGALEEVLADRFGIQTGIDTRSVPPGGSFSSVLSFRSFRWLWVGQAVSYFGDMMNTTGLAIMLYLVTRSPSLVALGLLSKAAPTILFSLVAGPIVDRFNRQQLMISADLVRALLTVTVPFFAVAWLPGVFVSVFLIATASAFFNPAKQAILPNLVPPEFQVRANSLVSSSEKTMELLGYSAAGVIAAAISWLPLFLIDAATYLFSALTLLAVQDSVGKVDRHERLRLGRTIVEGGKFVLNNAVLRSTMGLTFIVVFFAGMTFPILVIISYGRLQGGALGYGLLEAGIGAGAIIGALIAPRLMNRFPAGVLVLAGVAGMGAAYTLTGFSQTLWLALLFLFLGGIANTTYYVPLITLTQREAPSWIRGRVMATRFLLVQLGLLGGMALAGPLTDRLSAPIVFVTSGGLIVIAALVAIAFKNLRSASLRDEVAVTKLKASG